MSDYETIWIERNRYADSVVLMALSCQVKELPGVTGAEILMGTPANRELLESQGYHVPGTVTPNDLILVVRGQSEEDAEAAMERAKELLDHREDKEAVYHSLWELEQDGVPFDLVQISLPGKYAAEEADKALNMGKDVFIFSDNVSLKDEAALKAKGREKGLLVMGPDCGVGLIQGVALAAGSVILPGAIGIVGASGSGAQEIGCIIERCGEGVSSIIGTGGRDLLPEIGGISMIEGMKRLEADEDTRVIVLVSKLADPGVMERVLTEADRLAKPVTAVFLGGSPGLYEGHRTRGSFSLEDAALTAVELLTGRRPEFGLSMRRLESIAECALLGLNEQQKYFRGLYCGGTFTEEGLCYLSTHHPGISLYTNLNNRYAAPLPDHGQSVGNTILDMGAEDFTANMPHPVFEPAIRLGRFEKELLDPETAVILLDFITGPGVHPDPITPFLRCYQEYKKKNKNVPVILASICGAAQDPQNPVESERKLRDAGILVMPSNYESAKLAGIMMDKLERRSRKRGRKLRVVNIGLSVFYDALAAQGAEAAAVEWTPPFQQKEEIRAMLDDLI